MGSNKVTKATMKHILYEGARMSRILRINNSAYDRMIEILDLDLECESDNDQVDESENEQENEDFKEEEEKEQIEKEEKKKENGFASKHLRVRKNFRRFETQKNILDNSNLNQSNDAMKSKDAFITSYHSIDSVIFDSYSNDFEKAVKLLKNIIEIETNNLDDFKNIFKPKNSNKIAPMDVETDYHFQYIKNKKLFKGLISKLLAIRRGFSQKLKKDALPSVTTQPDEVEKGDADQFRLEMKKITKSKRCIDFRRDYIPKLGIIFILSAL